MRQSRSRRPPGGMASRVWSDEDAKELCAKEREGRARGAAVLRAVPRMAILNLTPAGSDSEPEPPAP